MRLPPFPALEARPRRVIGRAAPLLILILLGPAAAAARQAPGPVPQSAGSDAAATEDVLQLIEAQQKAIGPQPRDLESLTHQLEERGAPAQPQQPAQESRDQFFFIKIPGTDAAFKISGFGIDFASLNARVDMGQPLIRWSWAAAETVKVAFAFENPDSEMTGAARVNNRRDLVSRVRWELLGVVDGATLDIQPGSALSITRRYPGNVIWLPIPRLEFIARTLYGAGVNKDGHSLTAGQTQIGATFRF
jgi:hypothetical protein